MKKYILSLMFFTLNSLISQTKDTLFLLKDKDHKIYIDPNKKSKCYEQINNFKSFPKLNSKKLVLYNYWIPLKKYDFKYFLYAPCDWGQNIKIAIYDNNIYFEGWEISSYNLLKSSKISLNHYSISYLGIDNNLEKIEIFYIDKKKGIAVFKFIRNKNEITYKLMLESNKSKLFPIIVNDCKNDKFNEFNFQDIEFQKEIKKVK